jgi:5-formyltetrahydrofolate cyclo-ligase
MTEPQREAAYAVIGERMRPLVEPDARFDRDLSWFIPGFAEAGTAAERLLALDPYAAASTIFVTPDNGLAPFREAALRDGKTLVLPTYGLRRGFVAIDGRTIETALARYASWLDGLATFGRPVSLGDLARYRLELVVTAASAISSAGQRFGMGSAYLDLEYPILAAIGAVSDEAPVAALVHDDQYWPEPLPDCPTDIRADLIVTPTTTRRIDVPGRRPTGIDWRLVDPALANEPYFAPLAAPPPA